MDHLGPKSSVGGMLSEPKLKSGFCDLGRFEVQIETVGGMLSEPKLKSGFDRIADETPISTPSEACYQGPTSWV